MLKLTQHDDDDWQVGSLLISENICHCSTVVQNNGNSGKFEGVWFRVDFSSTSAACCITVWVALPGHVHDVTDCRLPDTISIGAYTLNEDNICSVVRCLSFISKIML
jgi:hypothetical protein